MREQKNLRAAHMPGTMCCLRALLIFSATLLAGAGVVALDFTWTASQAAYIVGLLGLTVIPAVLCLVTVAQLTRAPGRPTTFSPKQLAASCVILSLGVGLIPVTFGLIVLVDVMLVPGALMLLSLSWVQPREDDFPLTLLAGAAIAPALVWLVSRSADHALEGAVSGALVCVIVVSAVMMRRRGVRSSV